jgi:hypothetical protein
MPQRIGSIVPALLAGLLAAFTLTVPVGAVQAAVECLATPNANTPDGKHWYYRIDRTTQRKCWYLGAAGHKVRAAASPEPEAPDEPVAPSLTEKSAETPMVEALPGAPQANTRQGRAVRQQAAPSNTAPEIAAQPNVAQLNAAQQDAAPPAVAWPWLPAPAAPAAATVNSTEPAAPTSDVADDRTPADPSPVAPDAAPPALAAKPVQATIASPQEVSVDALPMLALLAGALAIAGFFARLIIKIATARRRRVFVDQREQTRSALFARDPFGDERLAPTFEDRYGRRHPDNLPRVASPRSDQDPDPEETLRRILRAWDRRAA